MGQYDREAIGRQYGDPDDEIWRMARLIVLLLIAAAAVGLALGRLANPTDREPPMFHMPLTRAPSLGGPVDWAAVAARAAPAERGPALKRTGASAAAGARPLPAAAPVAADIATAERALNLPGPIALSLLSNAGGLALVAEEGRARGHEIWLHVPMEPEGDEDPGPRALTTAQTSDELRRALDWHLAQVPGAVGVNNHMGSKFTADLGSMRIVLASLNYRGLMYLDSMTTPHSVGLDVARALALPAARRDVFLDHDRGAISVRRQLDQVERIAKARGSVIAIAHPHLDSLAVLGPWLVSAPARGLELAPVSAVVAERALTAPAVVAGLD